MESPVPSRESTPPAEAPPVDGPKLRTPKTPIKKVRTLIRKNFGTPEKPKIQTNQKHAKNLAFRLTRTVVHPEKGVFKGNARRIADQIGLADDVKEKIFRHDDTVRTGDWQSRCEDVLKSYGLDTEGLDVTYTTRRGNKGGKNGGQDVRMKYKTIKSRSYKDFDRKAYKLAYGHDKPEETVDADDTEEAEEAVEAEEAEADKLDEPEEAVEAEADKLDEPEEAVEAEADKVDEPEEAVPVTQVTEIEAAIVIPATQIVEDTDIVCETVPETQVTEIEAAIVIPATQIVEDTDIVGETVPETQVTEIEAAIVIPATQIVEDTDKVDEPEETVPETQMVDEADNSLPATQIMDGANDAPTLRRSKRLKLSK